MVQTGSIAIANLLQAARLSTAVAMQSTNSSSAIPESRRLLRSRMLKPAREATRISWSTVASISRRVFTNSAGTQNWRPLPPASASQSTSGERINKILRIYMDCKKEEVIALDEPDGNTFDQAASVHRIVRAS